MLGTKIKTLRTELGMTQTQFASVLVGKKLFTGLSKQAIANWEGKQGIKNFEKVAEIFAAFGKVLTLNKKNIWKVTKNC